MRCARRYAQTFVANIPTITRVRSLPRVVSGCRRSRSNGAAGSGSTALSCVCMVAMQGTFRNALADQINRDWFGTRQEDPVSVRYALGAAHGDPHCMHGCSLCCLDDPAVAGVGGCYYEQGFRTAIRSKINGYAGSASAQAAMMATAATATAAASAALARAWWDRSSTTVFHATAIEITTTKAHTAVELSLPEAQQKPPKVDGDIVEAADAMPARSERTRTLQQQLDDSHATNAALRSRNAALQARLQAALQLLRGAPMGAQ